MGQANIDSHRALHGESSRQGAGLIRLPAGQGSQHRVTVTSMHDAHLARIVATKDFDTNFEAVDTFINAVGASGARAPDSTVKRG